MRKTSTLLLLITFVSLLSACQQTLPLVSHAHVGHALTSWHDTPKQQGLYVTARNEAEEALTIMQNLDHQHVGQSEKLLGVNYVAYILNPDVTTLADTNFGQRYGVIRAMEGVLDHIEFAATSDDASLNLISSVNELSKNGDQLVNDLNTMFSYVSQVKANEVDEAVSQLNRDLELIINGKRQGDSVVYYGMANFTREFNAMLGRETNPRYEPLPRKYVLGLVRLPNGHWGYKLNTSQTSKYTSGSVNY